MLKDFMTSVGIFIVGLLIVVLLIMPLFGLWFYFGGIHLDYLKETSYSKAVELCGEDAKIVSEGYERSIFGGFGGSVWYDCKIDGVWFNFFITRRINNDELQVYNFRQLSTFPNKFDINLGGNATQ